MRMTELALHERPRERLLAAGPAALADAELLAIFLRSGRRGRNAVDVGRELIARFGGIAALCAAPRNEALQSPGLGAAGYCQLVAALELSRRVLGAAVRRDALTDPRRCGEYLRAWLGPYPYEVFACLFLDNRHRVIASEELFRGTIDGASVHPREVVRRALSHNAAAVILAHNHPSGVAEPSAADVAITRRLRDALALIDVRVLDHLIVGETAPVSLAERGLV
ncbi:MAG TPA: DNA repair protein RadC [Candidatus Saccharimonadia bacterium]|nr:DNA repair protein RadC [Candidatus Saccharimonadia bacterium]